MMTGLVLSEIRKGFIILENQGVKVNITDNSIDYFNDRVRITFSYDAYGNELLANYFVNGEKYNLFALLFHMGYYNERLLSIFPTSVEYLISTISFYGKIIVEASQSLFNYNSTVKSAIKIYNEIKDENKSTETDNQIGNEVQRYIHKGDYVSAQKSLINKPKKTQMDTKRINILQKIIDKNK